MPSPSIPLDVADLTAEWFTTVLGHEVRRAEVLDAHSGTTGRAQVALEGDDLPATVFVKLAPFDPAQRRFVDEQGMGVAEARFYDEVAAAVPVRMPRCRHAAWSPEGGYVMVFDDFTAAGVEPILATTPRLPAIVDSVIDQLGAMHAAFHGSPRFAPDGDLAWIADRGRGYGAGGAPFVEMAVESLGDLLGPEFLDFAAFYLEHPHDIARVLADGTPTLVHGDAHMGNMAAHGTDALVYDWAVIAAAPGLRDIAYFLTNSVPTELRRAEERRWLERWCAVQAAAGIDVPFASAWEQYRRQAITGWIAAVCTAAMGSKWQPIEVAVRSTKRSIAAVADLATRDAFAAAGVG